MFSDYTSSDPQELLQARLAQVEAKLRGLSVTTREEALALVYSALNQVLALGNKVSPLQPVLAEGPAIAGDLAENVSILNDDAQAIVSQLQDTEQDAAALFNLFAATQNGLRQLIREQVFSSTQRRYLEEFLNDSHLDAASTASVDFNAGFATLPLISDTAAAPAAVTSGISSIGTLDSTSSWDNLLDDKTETSAVWNGTRLELLIQFSKPTILNRVRIELLGYQGLSIEEFSSSPDGVLKEDLLAELPTDNQSMEGSSSKFSGDWIADFDPRHIQQIRLILSSQVGSGSILLRNLHCSLRRYATSAQVRTQQINTPTGTVVFRAEQHTADNLTSITHQISTDGAHFQSVQDGQQIVVGSGPFWYRGILERQESNFDQAAAPVDLPGTDPALSPDYRISSVGTIDQGGGVIERTLNFDTISKSVTLNETPLDGTLIVYDGTVRLVSSAYTATGRQISFVAPQSGITIRYQTSAYGAAGLLTRKDYFSPYLFGVRFERM